MILICKIFKKFRIIIKKRSEFIWTVWKNKDVDLNIILKRLGDL